MKAMTPPRDGTALPHVSVTVGDLRRRVEEYRQRPDASMVGLVPTMGCFHEGHLRLMRAARRECGLVVVSLFVNPAQFGPGEDFEAYPRDRERDLSLAAAERVDIVFTPAVAEVYPPGHDTVVEAGQVAESLCGAARPGHFRGVATVVAKLFNMTAPDIAYFGQKDAQQVAVIRQIARDLDFDVTVRACPTVREPDGLAMSSRNTYLSPAERRQAVVLYEALCRAREAAGRGENDAGRIREIIRETVSTRPLVELEYAEVVDPDSMEPVAAAGPGTMIALAARAGRARLIDNMIL